MKSIASVTCLSLILLTAAQSATLLAQTVESQLNPGSQPQANGYQQHLAQVAQLYGVDRWLASDRVAGLPLGELSFPGFEGQSVYQIEGRLERRFQGLDGLPSFHLDVVVGESVKRAQAALLEWLAGISSQAAAPAASELGIAVGDQGYVGLSGAGPEAVSWIAFVRGNVAVRVTASEPKRLPQPNLPAIAASIDQVLRQQDRLAEGAALPGPVIARLQVGAAACVAGAVLPLGLQVVGSAGEPVAITWSVGGTGQGYVERRDDGVWRLYTTGPGRIRLEVSVTGRLGVSSAVSHLEIQVADD